MRAVKWFTVFVVVVVLSLSFSAWTNRSSLVVMDKLVKEIAREKHRADSLERLVNSTNRGGSSK